jgi:hypothetical protein
MPMLPLADMHERHRALTLHIAGGYSEAAAVCLSRHHVAPVVFRIEDGEAATEVDVVWPEPDLRTLHAWNNTTDATRDGAYACVIAAAEVSRAIFAVRRAETATGADYYVRPADAGVGDLEDCVRLEDRVLASPLVAAYARKQLQDVLQLVWSARAADASGVKFVPGDVLVSVKGGAVIHGGAPLDLIVRKVEEIQAIFFRTIEMLLHVPVRRRGQPSQNVQEWFRPWLFQAPAGSYQFAVRVQEPAQTELFGEQRPKVDNVTSTFLAVLRASASNPETELPLVVADESYQEVFLKLSRNLSPAGTTFDRLEVRDASAPAVAPVTFSTANRREINVALRHYRPPQAPGREEEVVDIRGTLRALHLDRDWIEVQATEPMLEHVRIIKAGDVLDDVVGPMVNRRVIVRAVKHRGKYEYRDIEPEE